MGERYSGAPDKSEGMSRREFLGLLGAGVIGMAAGESIGNVVNNNSPERRQEAIGRIVAFSDKREEKIDQGVGLDDFFYKSGWHEEGYSREIYWDALALVNKDTNPETDLNNLEYGKSITVLYAPKKNNKKAEE